MTGKLDDEDYQHIWLPSGYQNFIKGSPFLTLVDNKWEPLHKNRKEAVDEYLADVKQHNARRKKMRNWDFWGWEDEKGVLKKAGNKNGKTETA